MKELEKKEKFKKGVAKGIINVGVVIGCMVFLNIPVFASTNIGENIGNWVLEQLMWFFLVGTLIGAGLLFIKRNWWVAGITIVVGGFLTYLTSDPMRIKAFGEA